MRYESRQRWFGVIEKVVHGLVAISAGVYLSLWALGRLHWGVTLVLELLLCVAWDYNSHDPWQPIRSTEPNCRKGSRE
jgi:hypothetical protein